MTQCIAMDHSPVFLKARTIAFSLISLISFIWIVLLCVDLFLQWDSLDRSEKSFLGIMLLTDTLTLIMLLVLIILPFRPWLDGARFLLLLIAHIGIASAFVVWTPQFRCVGQTDQQGACKSLNVYILVANWIIPAFLITYAAGLAFMLYKRSRQRKTTMPLTFYDVETSSHHSRPSILPIMHEADLRRQSVPESFRHNTPISSSSGPYADVKPGSRYRSGLPVEAFDVGTPKVGTRQVSRSHLSYGLYSPRQSSSTARSLDDNVRRPSTVFIAHDRRTTRLLGQYPSASHARNSRHQSNLLANPGGASPKRPRTLDSLPSHEIRGFSRQHLSVSSTPRMSSDGRMVKIVDAGDTLTNDVQQSSVGRSRLSKPLPGWMF